jgi:phosphinothricin acetyltransferase
VKGARVRLAELSDAAAIASIYNEGIAGREATFETEARSARDFELRMDAEAHPVLVAEVEGRVVGCAWTAGGDPRP